MMSNPAGTIASHLEEFETTNLDGVLEDLASEGILSHQECCDAMQETMRNKKLFLQEQLPLKGDHAIPTLIDILRRRNNVQLTGKRGQGG